MIVHVQVVRGEGERREGEREAGEGGRGRGNIAVCIIVVYYLGRA